VFFISTGDEVATSALQRYTSNQLSTYLGRYTIRENYRPDWLSTGNGSWLELDFFLEEIDVGLEVQGDQHYKYNPFFHKTRDAFRRSQ
jgi:hypothetical protein